MWVHVFYRKELATFDPTITKLNPSHTQKKVLRLFKVSVIEFI